MILCPPLWANIPFKYHTQDIHAVKWQIWVSKKEGANFALWAPYTGMTVNRDSGLPPMSVYHPAWDDGGQKWALGCLRRCCGDIWLPNLKDWTGKRAIDQLWILEIPKVAITTFTPSLFL